MAIVSDQPYPVTGVLNNNNVAANKFEEIDPAYTDWLAMPMDTSKSPIGYEWKSLDGWSWVIVDSLVYFVQSLDANVYKLVFTDFEGMSTGKIKFTKELISAAGIADSEITKASLQLFPNPVVDHFDVVLPEDMKEASLLVFDMGGRLVQAKDVSGTEGQLVRASLGNVKSGMYMVLLKSENISFTQKIIVK